MYIQIFIFFDDRREDRPTQKKRRTEQTHTDIYALNETGNHDTSILPVQDSSYVRPTGHYVHHIFISRFIKSHDIFSFREIFRVMYCGLVFRLPGCRPKGPGFDSRRYQIF
jgi:hypothetical protein